MNTRRITFRVDGSNIIGLGHLLRCYSLARLFQNLYEIYFYSKEIPSSLKSDFEQNGIICQVLEQETDFFQALKPGDLIVVDHYQLNSDWQKKIKALGHKLICIDDLQNFEFHADIIINHNPYVVETDYIAGTNTIFALGFEFAMIRPVFKVAATCSYRELKTEEIFICLGGSDSRNLTKKILEVLLQSKPQIKANVVLGHSYLFLNELENQFSKNKGINFFKGIGPDKMCKLMLSSKTAIVSASGILIEALATGCKIIGCYYAENQKAFHNNLFEERIIKSFGNNSRVFQKEKFLKCINERFNYNFEKIEEYRKQIGESDNNLKRLINSM